ncbi:transcription factor [Crepidotus variabilis]|uniref:Transcription factor n=1 Tax=Crepidotus variabilis TaxID=179855 RepID=A0A9P6JSD1_9AGAR|nr:transcription factor [Crepidotus variabilis]
MQAGPRTPGSSQPPVKIYNAVYSSVQVYECMVRGIAVMRRRADSYVNATQILKVAGVDKGRRTKILEKEILPGKHEIVQGGYGKYQGTWIPLERGRDIALQYGIAPLLAPLFDFQPSTHSLGALPVTAPAGAASPRPLSASSSYSNMNMAGNYSASLPSSLAPPPIMPGSALRLLNQGRAQGLFTPTTSNNSGLAQGRHPGQPGFVSPGPYPSNSSAQSPHPSQTPPLTLKRNRSEADVDIINAANQELYPMERSRPPSTESQVNGEENPSPAKRLRTDTSLPELPPSQPPQWPSARPVGSFPFSGPPRPSSSMSAMNGGAPIQSPDQELHKTRFSTKPLTPRIGQAPSHYRDSRRAAVVAAICQRDDANPILDLLREISSDPANGDPSAGFEIDVILDDHGHTALHIAASMARLTTVSMLLNNGADVHRGNFLGETPLIRACIATTTADQQCFTRLLALLRLTIRTLDTSRKSVLHHIVALAGVKGRAVAARYYLDEVFLHIAKEEAGDFRSIVDLQDEHGDTALNIAARVGNRSLVRTLLDVGANRILPNKLGLRPGDFGVETEELSGGPRVEDILSSLRTGPPPTVQKSQDVIADMTSMIQNLSTEFQSEIKTKQDTLDVTQAHLRAATRELSEQRKQIQTWQQRCGELDQINQRVRNVQKALADEDSFDWTGRTDLDGNDARASAGPAFTYRGASSTIIGVGGAVEISFSVDSEAPLPAGDTASTLIKLRRMKMWHVRMEELVQARLKGLQGASAEKEYQCKKIVALCTGLPIDKVETMLENLVIAVESESQIVDLGRVSGFMQKVRDGII